MSLVRPSHLLHGHQFSPLSEGIDPDNDLDDDNNDNLSKRFLYLTKKLSHFWNTLISKNFGRLNFRTNAGSENFTVRNFYRPKFLPSENFIAIILYRNFAKHFSRWRYLLNKSVLECFKVIGY